MNEEEDMNSSAELEQETTMDPQAAEFILAQTRKHARHELEINYPLLFVAWGLTLLIGYGALWLAVRGQHPYHGFTKTGQAVWLVLLLVLLFSATIRLGVVGRAVTGVGHAGRRMGDLLRGFGHRVRRAVYRSGRALPRRRQPTGGRGTHSCRAHGVNGSRLLRDRGRQA